MVEELKFALMPQVPDMPSPPLNTLPEKSPKPRSERFNGASFSGLLLEPFRNALQRVQTIGVMFQFR